MLHDEYYSRSRYKMCCVKLKLAGSLHFFGLRGKFSNTLEEAVV